MPATFWSAYAQAFRSCVFCFKSRGVLHSTANAKPGHSTTDFKRKSRLAFGTKRIKSRRFKLSRFSSVCGQIDVMPAVGWQILAINSFLHQVIIIIIIIINVIKLQEEQLQEVLKDLKLNTFINWYLNYMHSFNWLNTGTTKREEGFILGKIKHLALIRFDGENSMSK